MKDFVLHTDNGITYNMHNWLIPYLISANIQTVIQVNQLMVNWLTLPLYYLKMLDNKFDSDIYCCRAVFFF